MTTYNIDDFMFLDEGSERNMIFSACMALSAADWEYLKIFRPNPDKGFAFTNDKRVLNMMDRINVAYNGLHSGCSIGITMRIIHAIARYGLSGYRKIYETGIYPEGYEDD
jgi:hypothetical protein